jgi:two-component system, OmpR family, phosphate regulon response regulator PhoB
MLPQREEIASLVVCEDDHVTLDLLCEHLAADRFGVMPAPSASDALRLCRYNHPDLLLLDLSLPDASGLDVLREIREADGVGSRFDPRLPVIVLTGRAGDTDKVRGLDSGADDYLTKPFVYSELRARIGAVLRRRTEPNDGPARVGDLVIDPLRRRVTVGDREVHLAKKEFALLRVLAGTPCASIRRKSSWTRSGPTEAPPRPAPSTPTPAACAANSTPRASASSSTAGASATA